MGSQDKQNNLAEYFVVAGLSEKYSELLENCVPHELEVPLQNSPEDPIIDIAVIFRSLGEEAPYGYSVIEKTPLGYLADLNHGSLRSPNVFLCFKRGRDKLPIVDIGVMYEGKERVMPGCEVILYSPYGRPANVNNSGARTYITYRRSNGTIPNELTVSDICVILVNKGERPPHAFMKIDKNLNKGMVGSDVFICYKKTSSQINIISYKPALLSRYPFENIEDFPLPDIAPLFCLPMGATLEKWSYKYHCPDPVFSTFVLTNSLGVKAYGAAATFYEAYPIEKLTTEQRNRLRLSAVSDLQQTSFPFHKDAAAFVTTSNTESSSTPPYDTRRRSHQSSLLTSHQRKRTNSERIIGSDSNGHVPLKLNSTFLEADNANKSFDETLLSCNDDDHKRIRYPSTTCQENCTLPRRTTKESTSPKRNQTISVSPCKTPVLLQIVPNIYVNKAICLISRWPLFDIFKRFLSFLYNIVNKATGCGTDVPIEKYISFFMHQIPFPSPSRPQILVQLPFNTVLCLIQTFNIPSGVAGASFRSLLENLNVDHILSLVVAVLLETKIVLHSLRPSTLTGVCEALRMLIFPLHWQCSYIPLCPILLSQVLSAPVPYIIGLDSKYFDMFQVPPLDAVTVDLDTNTVIIPDNKQYLINSKNLPKKIAKVLKHAHEKICANDLRINYNVRSGDTEEEFKIYKKKELVERRIQDTFLRFMAALLTGYQHYLVPITKRSNQMCGLDIKNLFDFEGFILSRDRNCMPFYDELVQTQMFSQFIQDRSFVTSKDSNLTFFDEITEKVDPNAERDEQSFLKYFNDEIFNSDYTIFITPPDISNNPTTEDRKIYRYTRFPDLLDPKLFDMDSENTVLPPDKEAGECVNKSENQHHQPGDEGGNVNQNETIPHADHHEATMTTINDTPTQTPNKTAVKKLQKNEGSCTSSPCKGSPLITRTKQEIKSGKKSAQVNFENPIFRARFLLNACFSIWFLHLPAYVKCCENKRKALYCALEILTQIPRTGIKNPNELCYRILLQLCGTYQEPLLAVRVLREMKRLGLQPNAVTYGYYNKAVTESTDMIPDKKTENLSARLTWAKLRNVVAGVAQFKRNCPEYVYRHKFYLLAVKKEFLRKRYKEGLNERSPAQDRNAPSLKSSGGFDGIDGRELYPCNHRGIVNLTTSMDDDKELHFQYYRHRLRIRNLYSSHASQEIESNYFSEPEVTLPRPKLQLFGSEPDMAKIITSPNTPIRRLEIIEGNHVLPTVTPSQRSGNNKSSTQQLAQSQQQQHLSQRNMSTTGEVVKNKASAFMNSPFAKAVGQKFDKILTKIDNALALNDANSSNSDITGSSSSVCAARGDSRDPANSLLELEGKLIYERDSSSSNYVPTNTGTEGGSSSQFTDSRPKLVDDYFSVSSVVSEESSSKYDASMRHLAADKGNSGLNDVDASLMMADKTPIVSRQYQHARKVSAHTLPLPNPPSRTALQVYHDGKTTGIVDKRFFDQRFSLPRDDVNYMSNSAEGFVPRPKLQRRTRHAHHDSYGGQSFDSREEYYPNNNANMLNNEIYGGNVEPHEGSRNTPKALFKTAAGIVGNKIKDFIISTATPEPYVNSSLRPRSNTPNENAAYYVPDFNSCYKSSSSFQGHQHYPVKPSFLTDRAMWAEYSTFYKEHIENTHPENIPRFDLEYLRHDYGDDVSLDTTNFDNLSSGGVGYTAETPIFNCYSLKSSKLRRMWDLSKFESSRLHVLDRTNPYLASILTQLLRINHPEEATGTASNQLLSAHPAEDLFAENICSTKNKNELKKSMLLPPPKGGAAAHKRALSYQNWSALGVLGNDEGGCVPPEILGNTGNNLKIYRRFSSSSNLQSSPTSAYYKHPYSIHEKSIMKFDDAPDCSRRVSSQPVGPKCLRAPKACRIVKRINISTCATCPHCQTAMFDEEIIMGWFPDESNLNTKCRYCAKTFVPNIKIIMKKIDYSLISQHISQLQRLDKFCPPETNQKIGDGGEADCTAKNIRSNLNPSPSTGVNSLPGDTQQPYYVPSPSPQPVTTELHSVLSSFTADTPQNIYNFLTLLEHLYTTKTSSAGAKSSVGKTAEEYGTEKHYDETGEEIIVLEHYLSPLVLQKEVENILEHENGDECLLDPAFVREHSCVFWNMLWYFYRFGLPSFLPDLLHGPTTPSRLYSSRPIYSPSPPSDDRAEHENSLLPLEIIALWDNFDMYLNENLQIPLYLHQYLYQNNLHDILMKFKSSPNIFATQIDENDISLSLEAISKNDLYMALLPILHKCKKAAKLSTPSTTLPYNHNTTSQSKDNNFPESESASIIPARRIGLYREMLWLTLLLHDHLNYDAFDYEYKRAFQRLKQDYSDVMQPDDVPNYNDINIFQKYFCNTLNL